MALAVLHDALRLALASWRGQALVLAVGSALLGLMAQFGFDAVGMRAGVVVMALACLVLVGASARAAERAQVGAAASIGDQLGDAAVHAPRVIAQSFAAILPMIALAWLGMASMSLQPLLALVAIPLVFVAAVLVQPAVLLAIGAVAHGDRSWLPLRAATAVRRRPWALAGTVLVGGVAAGMVALPVVLVGMVLGAILGAAGMLGSGLAIVALVPLLGCGATALWMAAGSALAVDGPVAGPEADVAAAFAPMTWIDGPSFEAMLVPGVAWGTWIRIDSQATMGIGVTWGDGPAPHLSLATQSGAWTEPGDPQSSGSIVPVLLPAGSTYVQLVSRGASPQAITLRLLVHAASAAA